jgi:hypothetical protein
MVRSNFSILTLYKLNVVCLHLLVNKSGIKCETVLGNSISLKKLILRLITRLQYSPKKHLNKTCSNDKLWTEVTGTRKYKGNAILGTRVCEYMKSDISSLKPAGRRFVCVPHALYYVYGGLATSQAAKPSSYPIKLRANVQQICRKWTHVKERLRKRKAGTFSVRCDIGKLTNLILV